MCTSNLSLKKWPTQCLAAASVDLYSGPAIAAVSYRTLIDNNYSNRSTCALQLCSEHIDNLCCRSCMVLISTCNRIDLIIVRQTGAVHHWPMQLIVFIQYSEDFLFNFTELHFDYSSNLFKHSSACNASSPFTPWSRRHYVGRN